MRYPLVDGQGNFGSVDGDSAAAMRYTEARLTRIAEEMLRDLEKNTVDFVPNFDETLTEPSVLAVAGPQFADQRLKRYRRRHGHKYPATQSLGNDRRMHRAHRRATITTEKLMKIVKAPDFPTGGIIYGYDGVRQAYITGRGTTSWYAHARAIETGKSDRQSIVRHGDPVPGEQGQPHREDRRHGQRQET